MKSFLEYISENWSYADDFHSMNKKDQSKYIYHMTTDARAKKIIKQGLKPRSLRGRTNYPQVASRTRGLNFTTNHHGVRYWITQTAMAVNRRKREVGEKDYENIRILKFPIANLSHSTRRRFQFDTVGTRDARRSSDVIGASSHEAPTALQNRIKIK